MACWWNRAVRTNCAPACDACSMTPNWPGAFHDLLATPSKRTIVLRCGCAASRTCTTNCSKRVLPDELAMNPVLVVSIDTEEEFDWNAPFSASNRSVRHAADLPRL